MGKELWKVIPEFDDYEISNCGRIRCKERIVRKGYREYMAKEHYLKPVDNTNGYLRIQLKQNGRAKRFYIHRLVAFAFIENPENKPFINHIDNNPGNNKVENLEWCTQRENFEWMKLQGRNKRTEQWLKNVHRSQEKSYKPVIATNKETGEEIRFERLNDVKKAGFQSSNVCKCCQGKQNAHKGYYWRYAQ